ncbi:MAG: enoyl-CoA hydratase-related protein [Pseudomonadota bacterium]
MSLRLDVSGGVARLLIDRADKRNAFNLAMWEALPDLLAEALATPDVRALELTSADPDATFSAGADIGEMLAYRDDPQWLARKQAAINRAQFELTRAPIPTVAFVNGDCIGGGCGLAMACDLRVAAPDARFGVTPARLGLVYPLHDVKLLTDLVGPGHAKRLLYTGALIEAEEAQRIGLVESVEASSAPTLDAILASSPYSQGAAKAFVRRVLDGQSEDDAETLDIFAKAFAGADFTEGAQAFLEKRKPQFGTWPSRQSASPTPSE